MASRVTSRPIPDLKAYWQRLHDHVVGAGIIMKPVFDQARESVKRVTYAGGEDDQVREAAQQAVEEGIARPLLIGRRRVIADAHVQQDPDAGALVEITALCVQEVRCGIEPKVALLSHSNIAFNMLKVLGEGMVIGPILLGGTPSALIVTPGVTVRGLLNITALAALGI